MNEAYSKIHVAAKELLGVLGNMPQRYIPLTVLDDLNALRHALRAENCTEDFAKTLIEHLDTAPMLPHRVVIYRNQLAQAISA